MSEIEPTEVRCSRGLSLLVWPCRVAPIAGASRHAALPWRYWRGMSPLQFQSDAGFKSQWDAMRQALNSPLSQAQAKRARVSAQSDAATQLATKAHEALKLVSEMQAEPGAANAPSTLKKFAAAFNELQRKTQQETGPSGALAGTFASRDLRAGVRSAFADGQVLGDLHAAGVVVAREGLTVRDGATEVSAWVLASFEDALLRFSGQAVRAAEHMDRKVETLIQRETAVQRSVERATARAEKEMQKLYGAYQQASGSLGGFGSTGLLGVSLWA